MSRVARAKYSARELAGVDQLLGDVAQLGVGVLGVAPEDGEGAVGVEVDRSIRIPIACPTSLRASTAWARFSSLRTEATATEACRARICATASSSSPLVLFLHLFIDPQCFG
jgi:hypothetical protein